MGFSSENFPSPFHFILFLFPRIILFLICILLYSSSSTKLSPPPLPPSSCIFFFHNIVENFSPSFWRNVFNYKIYRSRKYSILFDFCTVFFFVCLFSRILVVVDLVSALFISIWPFPAGIRENTNIEPCPLHYRRKYNSYWNGERRRK